jgi:TetR/AcrR family transcriptional regulator, transcriptional repressor of bet genes
MGRPSNTEERRRQIARGLIEVMSKRGYEGASIAEIAKAAKLTPGLVHYHFENKLEILLAALDDLAESQATALEAHLAKANQAPNAQLSAFIDFHLALGETADPETLACWILLSGEAIRQPKVRARYSQVLERSAERISEVIRRGMDAGAFGCKSAEAASSAILAAIHGYFVLAATAPSLIPKGSAAKAAKQMAEGVLRQKKS